MPTLYQVQVSTEDFSIEEYSMFVEDEDWYEEDEKENVSYDEDGFENVCAETSISMERARYLAYDKAKELSQKFLGCMEAIRLHSAKP